MERHRARWSSGLARNSLLCLTAALAGMCPLVYESYCDHFAVSPNSVLSSAFGVLGGLTLFGVGPVSLVAWVVGAVQVKPERTLDALRSILIGCLIAFCLTASYVLRK